MEGAVVGGVPGRLQSTERPVAFGPGNWLRGEDSNPAALTARKRTLSRPVGR